MTGNVREWTHTPWVENHDPPRSTERVDDAKLFTLKRGGYHDDRTHVRCAARNWSYPYFDGYDGYIGCRVLLSPRASP
jgi:formylglycine-generating enzyme required for sulfatase activity